VEGVNGATASARFTYHFTNPTEQFGVSSGVTERLWWVYDYDSPDYKYDKYGQRTGASRRTVDSSVTPDGVYTVAYSITYKGATARVEFRINIGDTAQPIIALSDELEKWLSEVRQIGDRFEFSTKQRDLPESHHAYNHFVMVYSNNGTTTETKGGAGDDRHYADWWVARGLEVTIMPPNSQYRMEPATTDAENDARRFLQSSPRTNAGLVEYRLAGSDRGEDGRDRDWGWALWKEGDREDGFGGIDMPANARYGDRINFGGESDHRTWWFVVDTSGTYTISLTIKSASGHDSITFTRTITVETPETPPGIGPHVIWGTVLIVISVGLLLGLVVYFVQTGRKTKFAGTQGQVKSTGGGMKESIGGLASKVGAKLGLGKKKEENEPRALNTIDKKEQ
jgi:hypothetical protein